MNDNMVMRETQIQLPDINQTTLSQWYIKGQKKKEQEILKQELPQRTEPAASKTPLPAATPLPPSLPQVTYPVPFQFVLPTNATGTAILRGQTSKACRPMPILPAPVPPVPFLQPPTVVRRFPPVPLQSKIQRQHHQPQSWQQKSQSQPSHPKQKDETRTTQEPTNATGTAILRGQTSKACRPMPILPAPVPPVPFLQPPTVVRRFPPVPIQSKIQYKNLLFVA